MVIDHQQIIKGRKVPKKAPTVKLGHLPASDQIQSCGKFSKSSKKCSLIKSGPDNDVIHMRKNSLHYLLQTNI